MVKKRKWLGDKFLDPMTTVNKDLSQIRFAFRLETYMFERNYLESRAENKANTN